MPQEEKTREQFIEEIKLLQERLARLTPAGAGTKSGEEVREREGLAQTVLDGLPFLAWLKDDRGRFIAVNNSFAAACSQPGAAAVIGKTDLDVWPRELAEAYRADDAEVMGKRARKNVEELVADQGITKWFETFKTPVIDAQGRLSGTFGFSRDITGRKQAALESMRQAALINSLLDSIPDIIFFKDVNGVYLGCNPPFARFVGRLREEIIGKTDYELFDKEVAAFFRDQDKRMLEVNKSRHNEEWVTYPDGGKFLLDTIKTPYRGPEGELVGILGLSRDITERKRTEAFGEELLMLSTQLAGITAAGIPDALNMALQKIGRFLSADRSYIFEINSAKDTMSNMYEWCCEGIRPEIGNLQNIPCGTLPMWMAALKRRDNIVIPSVSDLPDAWRTERKILEPQGIQSLFVIPVVSEGGFIGFVGLDFVREKKELNVAEVNLLTVWSRLLSGLMSNQRSEQLLEKVRKNYQTFFNSINDFLFVLDERGNILHANDTVINRLGYTKEELLGLSVLMVHPPARREEAGRIVGEMLAGTAEFCPVPLVTKTGGQIPVETRVTRGFWNDKPAVFGVTKDMSQIKLSEEKFSKAFHSNSALMAISNIDDGRFMDVNQAFLKTLGFSRDEVIGKTSAELQLFSGAEKRGELVEKIKQGKTVQDIEIVVRTKDGSLKDGLFSADVVYIGKDRCLLTVMVDITKLKQADRALKETAEIKSKFASMVSHELRSPLTAVTMGISLVMEEAGGLSAKQKTLLELAQNNISRLSRLINDVMDFQKMSAGKMTFDIRDNDIGDLIRTTVRNMDLLAKSKGLEMVVDAGDNLARAVFDRDKITQVLTNLLSNAIAYTEKGTITIRAAHDGAMLHVSVRDTGSGIKSEDLPKLFQAFEQLDSSGKKGGTGLGLAISKEIIFAHNGKIWAESEPGKGAVFHFTLPINRAAATL
ncbi:MAG: PAS domain S-box protein [Elusimicrobiota bacterium]